jgi:hypothetical protein
MNSDVNIEQDLGGQNMVIKMGIFGKMNYKVINVIDTIYDIEVKYASLGMKMDMSGNSIAFSSDSADPNDMFSKVMKAMTDKAFMLKMNKKWKILEVKNTENLYNALNEFAGLSAEQKQQLKDQLAESYGENAFKGNLEMSSAIFPSVPVAKGDSWKTKTALRAKMAMDIENTFTLKEITDTYYIITSNAKIFPDAKADFVKSNGIDIKYNLNGTMNAEIKIDKKTGWIINGTYTQSLNGSNTIKAGEKIPEDMVIPMKMTNKMVYSNN